MLIRKAYQTLEDRCNYDYIEQNGPFKCTNKNAWLGHGYYFWDSFIENAHWWGSEGACYKNGYIICESDFNLDEKKCFNLVDNPDHLDQFNNAKRILIEKGLYAQDKTNVARVIEFIKEIIKVFKYEAIRSYPVNSISPKSKFINRTSFKSGKTSFQYLDSTPAIQICFYLKKSLNLRGYKIVYPSEYAEGYLV